MENALGLGADALILDLEDSVAPTKKADARDAVRAFLARPDRPIPLFVRINPLDSGLADDDLAAVIDAGPDGIMLPKAEGAASVIDLAQRLAALGTTAALILPIASETPKAVFQPGTRTEARRGGKEG